MAVSASAPDSEADSEAKLLPTSKVEPPMDKFHLAYIIHFILGLAFVFPWNACITAVDYFDFIYPNTSIDRIFSVVYLPTALVCLCLIIYLQKLSRSFIRINLGLSIFVISLLIVLVMDVVYIRGQVGLYSGFYVTVGAVALCGIADALVQGGLIGAAGELPERYMQAIIAGTAGSGVLVSALRIATKSLYNNDEKGLRKGANVYFISGIAVMVISTVLYNVVHKLPVMNHYKDLTCNTVNRNATQASKFNEVIARIKWHGAGIVVIYIVTLSIFPGYITEDVHSKVLKDWYPIILIAAYNVFDLVGKSLTAVYTAENLKVAVGGSFARLLFYPLFLLCMHGPKAFRTEIPVVILTCLLGLTNGYFTSVLMILAPKVVSLQHAETAGILMVLFILIGLTCGSFVSWVWVI